ncbi:unnamed protein product [Parnassius apollo]|uniref:(apollo) hypothetical protein n=1 Tax=Parnassius apollo TaxID=110799 RepID=A0A8S3XK38_PARAO|nr:unnamed protein product [Parnassius apollo]
MQNKVALKYDNPKLQYIFVVVSFIITYVLANTKKEDSHMKIRALEIEKNKLHQQINAAIDDSVRTLQENNDTDAMAGINYLNILKSQIIELNSAESKGFNDTLIKTFDLSSSNGTENRIEFNDTVSDIDSRRSRKMKHYELEKIFNPEIMITAKGPPSKAKINLENRLKIEKKLDEWILKRKLEKKRINEYRQKRKQKRKSNFEKCPNYGLNKVGKKSRRSSNTNETVVSSDTKEPDSLDTARRLNRNKKKYPCCRKCCKKSYMGCL